MPQTTYLSNIADEQPKEATPRKPRAKKYDPSLTVKGSFLDVIKASVKGANKKKEQ
jgi:hypothetical protein